MLLFMLLQRIVPHDCKQTCT